MESEGLQDARQQLLEAQAQLRHIKRSLRATPNRGSSAPTWKALRRSLEALRDLFSGWSAEGQDPEALNDPALLRQRNEIEARALRVETALRGLEERQLALDADRERALSELERVQEGWRLMRERASAGSPLPEGSLSGLRARIAALTEDWERSLAGEAEAERERQAVDRIWRWVMSVSLPELERRAAAGDRSTLLPTTRRLLEDLDRRWKAHRGPVSAPPAHGEALVAAQDLIASREGRIAVLAKELDFLKGSLEEARRQAEHWRSACDAARVGGQELGSELGKLAAELAQAKRDKQALERAAAEQQDKLSELEKRLNERRARREDERRWKEAQRERQRLVALLEEARGRSEERADALSKARKEHAELLAYFHRGEETVAQLSIRAADLEKRLLLQRDEFERELAKQRNENEILQRALDGSRKAFDDASARCLRAEGELVRAKSDLAELDQAHLALARRAEELEAERQAQLERERLLLEEEVRLRNRTAEAEGRAADRDEEVARLNAERERALADLRAERDEQEARLKAERDEEAARLKAEIEAAQARELTLQEEGEKLRRQAAEALGLAQARRKDVEKMQAEVEAMRARAEEALAEASAARDEEAKVKRRAEDIEQKLRQALNRLQATIDSTEAAAAEVARAQAKAEAEKAAEAERAAAAAAAAAAAPDWNEIVARLRDPVAAAYARLRQLSASTALPEGPRGLARLTTASLAEANDLLRNLSDYLNDQTPELASLKPEVLVDGLLAAWKPALKRRKIALKRAAAAKLPAVKVHADSLRSALNQALRNAYDAMPGGGTLTVRLSQDEAAGVVLVAISDTGEGFSKDYLEKPFSPFVSTKKGRLGLGLAVAQKLVRQWGGDLEASNVPGAGACLTFRLSAAPPEAADLS